MYKQTEDKGREHYKKGKREIIHKNIIYIIYSYANEVNISGENMNEGVSPAVNLF
uniref:Uncharacterized protein n=1 Tax=Macrobrachium rosenbergii bidensovirus TaxID=2800469 RepID=A0A7T7FQS8_9VIRU|nr:hypothetical protein [Macrobrachium rosenbergii bidensovirus]